MFPTQLHDHSELNRNRSVFLPNSHLRGSANMRDALNHSTVR